MCQVRNTTGATLTKGTAVYISGATGQIPTVSKALATSDATSAQTLGLMTADLANNSNGFVTVIGLISNMDTSAYTDGAQLYLSATTAGALTATKQYAPNHLVYMAVVEHAHPTQGKLFVKVQNGYELDEIHDVSAQTPTTGQTIVYNSATSLWEQNTVSLTAGVNGTLPILNGGTGQTTASAAFNALSPITTTGDLIVGNGTNSATRLGIGTNGYVLTSDGTTATWSASTGGVTSFSAGSTGLTPSTATTGAVSLAGTLAIANGGTGQTTANTAFNALAPSQTSNSGKYLTTDGTNSSWATVVSGASISNDTTTSTNLYPLFAAATSGTPTTIYTGNTKYLYKPSTGELSAPTPIATNGISVMSTTVSASYTIASGNNGFSVGPITVASGQAVSISAGQRWLIL